MTKKTLKNKRKNKSLSPGIALVEVIAALGISVVVITSLVSMTLFTLRASLQSKLLLEGTKVANRELELIRSRRDNSDSWEAFVTEVMGCTGEGSEGNRAVCSINLATGEVSTEPSVDNEGTTEAVTRYFVATNPDGSSIEDVYSTTIVRISVTASWKVGTETKSTSLYTDLSNWRGK